MVKLTFLSWVLVAVAATTLLKCDSSLSFTLQTSTISVPQNNNAHPTSVIRTTRTYVNLKNEKQTDDDTNSLNLKNNKRMRKLKHLMGSVLVGTTLSVSSMFGGMAALAADSTTDTTKYDGFATYAKENKMEQSDVSCFVNKCGDQTKALFSNPRGIKGVTCLGRCKGEQTCAMRCFADYGSQDLNNWLSCTIEENECVKVPKNIDNSAENVGYSTAIKNFDPRSMVGTWYKTDGLNPNYDLFDCQTNVFKPTPGTNDRELDMDIFFRLARPQESGGGFWENALTEHMVVDDATADRTMHTEGKMNGLTFDENWFIIGESDGKKDIPEFKLVAYRGHTLQGNYDGAFVYAKEPVLPQAAIPAVRDAATKAGLNFDDFTRIDNTW